jgi:hypothetical protein
VRNDLVKPPTASKGGDLLIFRPTGLLAGLRPPLLLLAVTVASILSIG